MIPIDPTEATVIVVEDNDDNMFILLRLLRNNCRVKLVEGRRSGASMFGCLAAHPHLRPDLILLDIQIPHEDGYRILADIRTRPLLRETLVVAVTANVMPQDVERCRQAGFDGFLGKPLNPTLFPEQLRRILAGEPVWAPRSNEEPVREERQDKVDA